MQHDHATRPQTGGAKFKVSSLPFSEIPHQSQLFLDYLDGVPQLDRFYPNRPGSPDELAAFAGSVLTSYQTDRTKLCDALAGVNRAAGSGAATFANIEMLRRSDTVAVVTGQQAGFLTGPAYTVYKALTAIKLASHLTSIGTPAVPVFWAASEDHDFEEVSSTYFRGAAGDLIKAEHEPSHYEEGLPVGSIRLGQQIRDGLDELYSELGSAAFAHDVRTHFSQTWSEGRTYSEAFLMDLAYLFREHGLILLDPMGPAIKELSAPIYLSAIEKSDALVAAVVEQSDALRSAGYEPQVLVETDYSPFFLIDEDGKRRALKKWRDNYRERVSGREYSLSDLRDIASSTPERISPGVILRPIVQDYLLPTVCYVGGGAEIAYFAQNSAAYQILDRPVTPIMHRQSFTIVEPADIRQLERLNLGINDLFAGRSQVEDRVSREHESVATSTLFANAEERMNEQLRLIDEHLSRIDPTLAAAFAKRRRKVIYHIAATHKKTRMAEARASELTGERLERLFSSLWPRDALQERTVNAFSFIARFGPKFIDWLFEAADLNDKGHRILELK